LADSGEEILFKVVVDGSEWLQIDEQLSGLDLHAKTLKLEEFSTATGWRLIG
jgi:hypothetical protein